MNICIYNCCYSRASITSFLSLDIISSNFEVSGPPPITKRSFSFPPAPPPTMAHAFFTKGITLKGTVFPDDPTTVTL